MRRVNESDRKIISTRGDGLIADPSYRVTDAPVVGVEYVPARGFESGGDTGGGSANPEIGTVRNIQLESQVVRIQADGSAVIDVTISFESADGADRHEVRLSKV